MQIIDFKQYRKKILMKQSLENEINLILQFKSNIPELRIRLSLVELKMINEFVYQIMEENNQVYFFFEYMDSIVSTALYNSFIERYFNREVLLDSAHSVPQTLNYDQISDIDERIEKRLRKEKKIPIPIEVRCKHGKIKI